jgi:thermostable 8-oxoguanine DNA glycosylase
MIDPLDVINYDRSDFQLEEFLLFAVIVAGKTAKIQSQALFNFLLMGENYDSPFKIIKAMINEGELNFYLKEAKIGQYRKISRAFREIVESNIDLKTCTTEELESIHGIGPKTSRFFILYTRKNQNYAVLDTHILKFMREKLNIPTPKTTPSGKQYQKLEEEFIKFANSKNKTIEYVDLAIWSAYSTGDYTYLNLL